MTTATRDIEAVRDLLALHAHTLVGATATLRPDEVGRSALEWEFRFASFRPAAAAIPDHPFPYQHDLLPEEFASIQAQLASRGWTPAPTETFTRICMREPRGAGGGGGGGGQLRVTYTGVYVPEIARGVSLTGARLCGAAPAFSYKRPNLVDTQAQPAARDLAELLHVRASMQMETEARAEDRADLERQLDAALARGAAQPRAIRRTSYTHRSFPSLTVDCSVVESRGRRSFEVELEIRQAAQPVRAEQLLTALRCVVLGVQGHPRGGVLLSGPRWARDLAEIYRVLNMTGGGGGDGDLGANSPPQLAQPVSIGREHLARIARGEFAAAAKADGTRCLLVCLRNTDFYRLSADMQLSAIRLPAAAAAAAPMEVSAAVFDAEWVQRASDGADEYLVFDLLHCTAALGGQAKPLDLRIAPLPERLEAARLLLGGVGGGGGGILRLKDTVLPGGSMPADNATLFEFVRGALDGSLAATSGFRVDGLVFTEAAAPIPLALHAPLAWGDRLRRLRWGGAFKYKSRADTTIDFQLGAPSASAGAFPLLVRAAGALVLFRGRLPEDPDQVQHSYLWPGECTTAAPLATGDVVECSFHLESRRWRAVRLRPDKFGPNDEAVAEANWALVHSPVEPPRSVAEAEHALLLEQEEPDLPPGPPPPLPPVEGGDGDGVGDGDEYYAAARSADTHTAGLRGFHSAVKQAAMDLALERVGGGGGGTARVRVLDAGIGRGGDLGKYLRYPSERVDAVLGLDISTSNLRKCLERFETISAHQLACRGVHGAAAPQLSLIAGSAATCFQDKEAWLTGGFAHWGGGAEAAAAASTVFERFLRPEGQFQVAVMHFALHYLWDSERTLDAFLRNLTRAVARGGVVCFTCFRGDLLAERFRHGGPCFRLGDYLELQAEFDVHRRPFTESDCFGFALRMRNASISDSASFVEWLVHPQVLRAKMRRAGFRAVPLSEFFQRARQQLREGACVSPLDETFLDLYLKWRAPPVVPPEQLQSICSWNELFVFERVDDDLRASSASSAPLTEGELVRFSGHKRGREGEGEAAAAAPLLMRARRLDLSQHHQVFRLLDARLRLSPATQKTGLGALVSVADARAVVIR